MSSLLSNIRHLLIDVDGVLFRGSAVLPRAPQFIEFLHDRGIAFRLVTNNATLTPERNAEKLNAMGIPVIPSEVFTSALAAGRYLTEHGSSGQSAYVIGEEGLIVSVRDAGLRLDEQSPDWVVAGLDRTLTYAKLLTAALALERGASFLASNADTSLPTEGGFAPGAGAILAALVATTGKEPIVIGKPNPTMLELAMHDLGGSVADTAMLGDRLDTDIQAGHAAGMETILILTGVSRREDISTIGIEPGLVVDDLETLMRQWSGV